MSLDELENTTERVTTLCNMLFRHEAKLTTEEAAYVLGITWQGAYKMLTKMSVVVPIRQDDKGRWCLADF